MWKKRNLLELGNQRISCDFTKNVLYYLPEWPQQLFNSREQTRIWTTLRVSYGRSDARDIELHSTPYMEKISREVGECQPRKRFKRVELEVVSAVVGTKRNLKQRLILMSVSTGFSPEDGSFEVSTHAKWRVPPLTVVVGMLETPKCVTQSM